MKKRIPLLALALALMCLLGACQPAPAATTPTPGTPAPATAAPAATAAATAAPAATAAATPVPQGEKDSMGFVREDHYDLYTAAQPASLPAAAASRPDTLIVGTSDFNGVFNPLYVSTAYDNFVLRYCSAEAIPVENDGKPGKGYLDVSISADGLTYTYKIAKDVKWSDGVPQTSADFEFWARCVLDKSYDGSTDLLTMGIVGAQDFYDGKADDIAGVKIVDEKTFTVTLERPFAPAMYGTLSAVAKHYYEKDYKRGDLSAIKANNVPLLDGPYKFDKFVEGQYVELSVNDNYFGQKPVIPKIIVKVVPGGQELQALMAGDVDIAEVSVNTDNIQTAADAGFVNIYRYANNGYGYIGFTCDDPVLQDVKVRQAIAYATNRKDVVATIYGDTADVISIPESRVSWAYVVKDVNNYDYDLAKAAQLLTEAGWTKDASGKFMKDGKPLVINFAATQDNVVVDTLAPVMKDSLTQLGVEFNIETVDFPTLRDRAQKGTAQMYFMAWLLSADPDSGSNVYRTGGSQNYYRYGNPEVDRLYEAARAEMNMDKRAEYYGELYKILNNDLPVLPVYQRANMWCVSARVKNFDVSPYRFFMYNAPTFELAK